MPGIFLSNLPTEEREILSPINENNDSFSGGKSHWRNKKNAVLLLLIFLLAFSYWNKPSTKIVDLPMKNVDFTGREKELSFLKKELLKKRSNRGINIVAICGEAGIGKTELATAFANDNINNFSFVGWIDGTSDETIMHAYSALGDVLEIKENNPFQLKEKVHRKLESFKGKPWLLIMDDMREVANLPKSGGSVLVTCRDKSYYNSQTVLDLSTSPQEAELLLSKLLKQKKSESITKLAEKLDHLPLMINLAGHYIVDTPGMTLSNYLNIISSILETEESPLRMVELSRRYPRSLEATYKITLQLIEKKHPLSYEFLKQTIFLHHKNIPADLITRWLEGKNIYTPAQIIIIKGDILRELQNHALIQYEVQKDEFSLHQLLHRVLALEFKSTEDCSQLHKILTNSDAIKSYNPTRKETIRPFQKILPHVTAILECIKDPDIKTVSLALTASRYFIDTDHQLEKGGKYLSLARKWTEGWDHPIKGRIAFLQGVIKVLEADSQNEKEVMENGLKALAFFNEALEVFQEQNKEALYLEIEQNPSKCTKEYQRAICLQYQGQTYRILGRIEEAEKILNEAMGHFQNIAKGGDHFDIARIIREQALILWKKKKYDAAFEKMENAISMQERVYGDAFLSQHSVAVSYRILGDFFFKKGEFLRSDQAYQKAIQINEVAYQTEYHPHQTKLYYLRAKALRAQGEEALAENLEKKTREISQVHP